LDRLEVSVVVSLLPLSAKQRDRAAEKAA